MNTLEKPFRGWFRTGLFSLAIVALFGSLMRYKIAFDFPYFDQKNLLHAHSHFAFGGWLTHMLYTSLVWCMNGLLPAEKRRRYHVLIALNLLFSFGMLFAFTAQGYGPVSILFSTLTIAVAIAFFGVYTGDARRFAPAQAFTRWARMGLFLNVFSAAGPLFLAYMMATRNIDMQRYLGSVYYYLHFQYSGWFFFASMSLLVFYLPQKNDLFRSAYRVFSVTVFISFFLSILWAHLPVWLVVITSLAAIAQLLAWLRLLRAFAGDLRALPGRLPARWISWFLYGAVLSMTLKFVLQTVSAIPHLSQLVFGFRPIVIAYLHLVLLGVYSLFLVGWLFVRGVLTLNKTARSGSFIFLAGVVLNETLLAVQGFASFAYVPIPYIHEALLLVALLLLTGAALLAWSAVSPSATSSATSSAA